MDRIGPTSKASVADVGRCCAWGGHLARGLGERRGGKLITSYPCGRVPISVKSRPATRLPGRGADAAGEKPPRDERACSTPICKRSAREA